MVLQGGEERKEIHLKIPANDVYTFKYTVKGEIGSVVGCRILSLYSEFPIMGLSWENQNAHHIKYDDNHCEAGGYYYYEDCEIAYLAGSKDSDGIDDIKQASDDSGDFYNLQGQKVSKPSKGIYIKNGKKVVVK